MEPLTSTKPHEYSHPHLGHFTESVQIRAPLYNDSWQAETFTTTNC